MELYVMHRFDYVVNQACQTQTTSRAANATKTDKKELKLPHGPQMQQKLTKRPQKCSKSPKWAKFYKL